jgi:glycosyltransferase involved in cell wall biosynthesis
MRVAIIAPWFRTLAQIHGRALQGQGHQSLVITTAGHFQPGYGFVDEVVLPARLKDPSWPQQWLAARRRLARWRPDLVLVDQTWDARLSAFARPWASAVLVHDAVPHDASHVGPRWQRELVSRQRAAAPRLLCFSRAVAARLAKETGRRASTVPLTSEMPQELVPELAPPTRRRDFVVLGRVSPYKNLDTVFRAWSDYVEQPGYCGDALVLIGDGELTTPLPDGARWERGRFAFSDVVARVHAAKASIVMYGSASQSGAQLTSMQMGVSTVASDVGGLPEYQPGFRPCLKADDAQGLTTSLLELTDPDVAAREGALARQHYELRYSERVAGAALLDACSDLVRQ